MPPERQHYFALGHFAVLTPVRFLGCDFGQRGHGVILLKLSVIVVILAAVLLGVIFFSSRSAASPLKEGEGSND